MSIVRLVERPKADIPIDRLWLVFFGEVDGSPWWARLLAPGCRHVAACAWFAEQERWVYFNPTRRGTVILLYREDEFGGRFTQLMNSSSCVLRVRSTLSRSATPFGWWCTGAVKALLGVKARALAPRGLRDHLLRRGAEVVKMPGADRSIHGEPIHP
ncbi:hypothetical protein IVB03_39475 [Bradyrhizobium sp. 168]|uniref:hypothetical protein n=1 Tax=Bradyrhizobium sp. 168 TaxID=2782639 RepID=UPI001FFAC8A9|nr:hypothetical protein [Bradyrhizobium sp. 168]MCK1585477.1 hypothetical protein [Bradyrhizobium sp. 168]